ncbi:MAG: lipopolysaccharide assembly protein LapA domain-containing protein [Hydrogenophilaceae bacterium]
MRALTLVIKLVLFLLLLAFAIKNSEVVGVHYLMGLEWRAPLSLVLLLAFALGVLLGLLGASRQILNNRRELIRLRKAKRLSKP